MNAARVAIFIIFILLQICCAQPKWKFPAVAKATSFGATHTSVGAAKAKAGGDKAKAKTQVVAGPGFVVSTAKASASGKKKHGH